MKNFLTKYLKRIRLKRLTSFGYTGFLEISNDLLDSNLLSELEELWYSNEDLSFVTLRHSISNIERISLFELLGRITDERRLLFRLEKIFRTLKKRKRGIAHGKN